MNRLIRRSLGVLVALLGVVAPASAQTVAVNVAWDPPLQTEVVVSYNLYVDALAPVSKSTAVDATCTCIKAPIAVTVGNHTVKVTAIYLKINTDPTTAMESLPATVTFTINAGAQIRNIKVTKP